MIESIMYFAGGFLVACLLALALISSVHHRAVRLTQRRLADSIPVSLNEIQADRDKLRARFAMSTRRLEVTVEKLEAKVASQLGEIARKSEAIARLKAELARQAAATDIRLGWTAPAETPAKTVVAATAPAAAGVQALAAKDVELADAARKAGDLTVENETHRVEIAILKTQLEQFLAKIGELERDAGEARQRLFDEQVTVANLTRTLAERNGADDARRSERAENEFLRERIADIAAQVANVAISDAGAPAAAAAALKEANGSSHDLANHDRAGHDRANNGATEGPSLIERIRSLTTPASAT